MRQRAVILHLSGWLRACAAAILVLLLVQSPNAQAQDQDPFTATVPVDATADSAAKARDVARTEGQRRALQAIADRLAGASAPAKLPKLDDKTITGLVANFEVAKERMSAVRYSAEYTFHFRPAETRRALGNIASAAALAEPAAGSPTASGGGKPLVVLPVFQPAPQAPPLLWDEPNPWREAWEQHPPDKTGQRLVIPLGDAGDLAAIDAAKARGGDAGALAAVAKRNGADDTVVAAAVLQGPQDKPNGLDLTVRRYKAGQAGEVHTETIAAKPGESLPDLMTRAVAAVGAGVGGAWKKEASGKYDQQGTLTAVLAINGLEDWVSARDRIAGLPMVKKINLIALSRQEATIEIGYMGSVDQLKDAFAGLGLTLARGEPAWQLTRGQPTHVQ